MYEFPGSEELSFLVSDTLIQICLDPYSTQFRFDRCQITVEHMIEQEIEGKIWRYECVAAEGPPIMLHRLVGKKVAAVNAQLLRLSLTFEDGAILHVASEIGPYESGHISGHGKFIVF